MVFKCKKWLFKTRDMVSLVEGHHVRRKQSRSFQGSGSIVARANKEFEERERLRSLRSYYQMRMRVKPGSAIYKTTNYFNAPGFMGLVHEDARVLEEDYAFIRTFEKKELFEIETMQNTSG